MATKSPKPKEQRPLEIPWDLQRFLAQVHQQIETGDEAATIPSDDLLQARCAYGGRISEDSNVFGFTYFLHETDGKWEFLLMQDEIRNIASGETKTLDLWHCKSPECANAFSQEDALCDECDWEREAAVEEETQQGGGALADIVAQMQALDPDFGKVHNDSGDEFAFEVTGPVSVAEAAGFSEQDAEAKIKAKDDFDAAVTSVPLAETTRSVLAHPFRSLILLGDEPTIPPGVLVQRVARAIMHRVTSPKEFELYDDELDEIRILRFYRFYHGKGETWWSCTFDSEAD